ncbi:Core-2/I-Branching enzyme [Pseudobutyrivibrio sp. UC1225]|uniref:beta-1,6-N-acetylglucosaminyltransferase n=1 Tax=Pseudobutyrivibrio sp. UC1225 TaxID=1798185 RepID=UPI0008EE2EBB|nr:beta-1,6-N-acetylglucosaminyltransferase [Pseudobutyrivibrio sp. UC1225]SFO24557.1 Core-2/I-Branching enzyme [Pseudobutyrivibrio sp. UC1225]
MSKHAYLIICHNNWKQLNFLIDCLNDPRNDFYIMVDSKATDFDCEYLTKSVPTDNLYFVNQIDVRWGDYSLFEASLSLLKAASAHQKYSYYHLLSGVDMPLKSQTYIHNFFDSNQGYEFVDFDNEDSSSLAFRRTRYYYLLQKYVGRKRISFFKILRDVILIFEKILHVNRVKDIQSYLAKGSNWFSITDDFAHYIIGKESFIKKYFYNTYICDEIVVQTLLNMSPYKDNWYGNKNHSLEYQNMRYLDWGRGKPYTFSKDDFFELHEGEYLFARKFSTDIVSNDIRDILLNKEN